MLVGFETDVGVFQSAVGLQDAGHEVIAVEDATFSPGEMHGRGLERLRDAGVRLTHCKSLAYEWVRTVERSTKLLSSGVLGPPPFKLSQRRGRGATQQVALAGADGAARRRAAVAHERELRVGLDALGDHDDSCAWRRRSARPPARRARHVVVLGVVGDHRAVDT